MHFICYVLLAAGITAGNYAFQLGQDVPDWGKAFERSFFGVEGVLLSYLTVKFVNWNKQEEEEDWPKGNGL